MNELYSTEYSYKKCILTYLFMCSQIRVTLHFDVNSQPNQTRPKDPPKPIPPPRFTVQQDISDDDGELDDDETPPPPPMMPQVDIDTWLNACNLNLT